MTRTEHSARIERRRGFQPPWYSVVVYRCAQTGTETTLRVSWRGSAPRGAIVGACGHIVTI